ncbi:MAG: type II toxin-antitoxin system Phd/YefM family antitoxin [Anaerolineae bacterium]|nr:type II toxin-antitoxin system Phd/YefM family antitoxin [Anaerolineae bacterium]
MDGIGVRELKTHASEIVRNVKERRKRYLITHHGRPVALLIPLEEPVPQVPSGAEEASPWEELIRLGREIGRTWQPPQTSAELLSEMRR